YPGARVDPRGLRAAYGPRFEGFCPPAVEEPGPMTKIRLTATQSRIAYDMAASVASAAFAAGFAIRFLALRPWSLVFGPLAIVGTNWMLGIYTRARVGPAAPKVVRLSASLAASV